MHHRRFDQGLRDAPNRRLQHPARLINSRQQRGWRNFQSIQVGDQLRAARERQQLALRQMNGQRANVRPVLHRLAHARGKSTLVQFAARALQSQGALFDHFVTHHRNVEHLSTRRNLRVGQRQELPARLAALC